MKHRQDNKDHYFDSDGLLVFTEHYHLEKGRCCGLGCRHCPYNYKNVPEPKRAGLLNSKKAKS